jgi:YYY domain-containing protein
VTLAGLLIPRRGSVGEQRLGFRAAPLDMRLAPSASFAWLRSSWRMLLGYEALFALALLFLALLRSHDLGFVGPNPWGTERPMDYALFNAIRQSERFPPHDPWMAGYSINYYYFGYLLMACATMLSGLSPAVAYNLSLALVFALAALGASGLVYNLVGLTRPEGKGLRGQQAADEKAFALGTRRSAFSRWPAMLLAVVLVLFAGNQGGALQLLVGDYRVVALDGRQVVSAVVQAIGGVSQISVPNPTEAVEIGVIDSLEGRDATGEFNWWWPSRSVWDTYWECDQSTGACTTVRRYVITEFPFFSFWLGDMHPHVMALPFGLLAMALALHTIARPALPAFGRRREGWLELVLVGIVLGSLYVINSWDLPTYVLLFLGALAVRFARDRVAVGERPRAENHRPGTRDQGPKTQDTEARQGAEEMLHGDVALALTTHDSQLKHSALSAQHVVLAFARQAGIVLLAAFALFLPFHLTFRSLVGGKEPLVDIPLLGGITRTIGFVTWGRTELHQFLIIFGLFLVPLVAHVLLQGRRAWAADEGSLLRWWPWATLLALALGVAIGFPLFALLPLGLGAARLAFVRAEEPAAAFTLGAFALGCAVCFGTELVYIRDTFESRFNTIFKFYYQVWLIWGVLAAYAVWFLVAGRRTSDRGSEAGRRVGRFALSSLVLGLFVALLAGALVYPWHTAGQAFAEGQQVGLAGVTPRERTPDGAASIAWLRANARGDDVLLEAVGPAYDVGSLGFGGVSSATGLAAVMGWEGHQKQWRGGQPAVYEQIEPRAADVATIYSTADVSLAQQLLQKYGVDLIYVGGAERGTYPPEGLEKLAQIGEVVFQQGDVTIYRMRP